eukprot:CAMPEP_0117436732 /NCGR_PEP_ID=MMETSP0759-20121206/1159_1 /TAXON_ID=63605 /ORGANISM="Percolomonas cosmopolitus, Strain WS" /LENGTH=208 /DNA_ID=CAMNT_0005228341 /DNA_START=278 /DNA_END=905 /DNA_ORIENTATION=-
MVHNPIDLHANSSANENITIDPNASWKNQASFVEQNMQKFTQDAPLDAVVCVAGGWAGGNLKSDDLIDMTDAMWRASLQTSMLSAQIAAKHMKQGGLLVLPGAYGAINPTPGMIGYGVAKSAIHHLVRSCAEKGSGMPKGACTVGIMPTILDTEMNRKAMPNADFKDWTPLSEVSDKIAEWIQGNNLPRNGSLVKIETKAGATSYETF